MGLLDGMDSLMSDPKMALYMGLLEAGGNSPRKISLGQGLSHAFGGYQQALQNQEAMKQRQMQGKLMTMQMQEAQNKMDDETKVRQFFSDPTKFMSSPASQALANGQGPTPENARLMETATPQLDVKSMYRSMLQSGSPKLAQEAIAGLAKQEMPKLKSIEKFEVNGKVMPVQVFENGNVKTMDGFNVPPEIVMQNMGNRVVAINKNNLQGGESMNLGVSPDAQLNASVTMRGQNMTDSRDREKIFQPTLENGQWVYKPTQANPQGASVPVQGFNQKLPEGANKQLTGVRNVTSAADDYIAELSNWNTGKMLTPDARASMGTKYNNLMLQAKEAYNLGVLNGPDYQILTSIIADPNSPRSALISTKAMTKQAEELKRLMGKISEGVNAQYGNANGNSDPLNLRGK